MAHQDGQKSPKSTPLTRDAFRRLVPDDERVTVRPMFGSVAAFVSGQMFMCLFADGMYFKLSDVDRAELEQAGGGPLEPMPGRPMKSYASLPDWQALNTLTFTEVDARTTLTIRVQRTNKDDRAAHINSGMETGTQKAMDLLEQVARSLR